MTMPLETVLKDAAVDSMAKSVRTHVLRTVIHQIVTRTQAIVTLGVLLVSLAKNAMNHVLLIV